MAARQPVDLLIRHARLLDGRIADLAIAAGVFVRIGADLSVAARQELDASGQLTTPPLADCHMHLDSVLTLGQPRFNESGTLLEGIQLWSERKPSLTKDDVKRRALTALTWAVAQGTLWMRSHVDICDPDLTALRALLELRDEVRDIIDLQLVAFPQDGIFSFPAGPDLLDQALALGADVVGGIPHYEATAALGEQDVHFVFELARKYGRPIDCHCDETDDPHSRFVEVLAANAIRDGLQGRVTASHCTAMHSYDNAYAFKLLRLLARAGVNIVANPLINIILQGRFDTYPKRRGMARVKELLAAGVNISLGHDCIMDPWYPLGRGDMLAVAQMALHVGQLSGRDEIDAVFDLITTHAARTLGVTDRYGIEEGKPASLVIFDATSRFDLLRLNPARRWVLKNGHVVATTQPARSELQRPGQERETIAFTLEHR